MVSQALDTLLFMFIAFWQVAPQFDALFILQLALPYYLLKILFAALDTPLVYLGVQFSTAPLLPSLFPWYNTLMVFKGRQGMYFNIVFL